VFYAYSVNINSFLSLLEARLLSLGLKLRVLRRDSIKVVYHNISVLLDRGPLALRSAKQTILQGLSLPLNEGMKLEQQLFTDLLNPAKHRFQIRRFWHRYIDRVINTMCVRLK
jgi:hypothetical protein